MNLTALPKLILEAYAIHVHGLSPVSQGYRNVYKVIASDGEEFALLLHRPNKTTEELEAELYVLSELTKRTLNKVRYPVGVSLASPLQAPIKIEDRFMTLHPWISYQRFDGSDQRMVSAFAAYHELQTLLNDILPHCALPILAIIRPGFSDRKYEFARFIGKVPPSEPWRTLFCDNLPTLRAAGSVLARDWPDVEPFLTRRKRVIIHYDPSHQNVGFGTNGHVNAIFDFDQCKVGVSDYDVPWMLWSFAGFRRDLETQDFIDRLTEARRAYVTIGTDFDERISWYLLLARFCLTLYGRLCDTYDRGFHNLRFMEEKIISIDTLLKLYDNLR